jgi:diaminohydroxyphosphoribosylaminopyrimidine deaminase/5-amino-6-(5-phosphoribosylamino)uracil reductase
MSQVSPFMQRALDAAQAVRGYTSPNPWVGAVVVREGEVAGIGATSPPGGAHAEAAALASAGGHGSDLYVTLEPCVPFEGKRTRPCVEAILESGVGRVVVALEDPDPHVRGKGIAHLREAGVTVEVGDGRDEARDLLRPYLKHRQTELPYVIAKFAASLDGRVATASGDSKWITGEPARDRVHEQRAWVDAILVGSGTVLADDPALTARPGGALASRQPARVVLDARGRISPAARIFGEPGHTIVATSCDARPAWKQKIASAGAQIIECDHDGSGINLDQLFATLGARGILSIWAEGGGTVLGSLFEGGHVDEVWAFIAPVIIGGDGLPAVAGEGARALDEAWRLRQPTIEVLGTDVLVRGYTGAWSP